MAQDGDTTEDCGGSKGGKENYSQGQVILLPLNLRDAILDTTH